MERTEQAYWQALRDYVKEYSWYSAYLLDNLQKNAKTSARLQREALTALDAQIAAQGFRISGGQVEIVVVDECIESKTMVSVGR